MNSIFIPEIVTPSTLIAEVTITNAEVLLLNSAPKELVPAPGLNKFIEFIWASIWFDFTAAYTSAGLNWSIQYGTAVDKEASPSNSDANLFRGVVADRAVFLYPFDAGGTGTVGVSVINIANTINKGLYLKNHGGGEFGGGNAANVFYAKVAYRIWDAPF